jgi:hypothetical protein
MDLSKMEMIMSKTDDTKIGHATQNVGTCTRRELRDDELEKVSGGVITIDGYEIAAVASRAFGAAARGGTGTGTASWDLKKNFAA